MINQVTGIQGGPEKWKHSSLCVF